MSNEIKIKVAKSFLCLTLLVFAAFLIDNWFIFFGVFLMVCANNIEREKL